MKLIFLDMDGVMNNWRALADHRGAHEAGKGPGFDTLDAVAPHMVKNLNVLLEASQAHLVLSSTWRLGHIWGFNPPGEDSNRKATMERVLPRLHQSGLDPRHTFLGFTPDFGWLPVDVRVSLSQKHGLKPGREYRHLEIQHFLNNLPEQPESFVILDDIPDFGHLRKHHAKTSMIHGFDARALKRAMRILGCGVSKKVDSAPKAS